jgi:rhamnosyltransferase
MTSTVSCIVRTYNEAQHIGKLIEVLQLQGKALGGLEIVVVDSGSTDSTVEIVRNHNVNLIQIPKEEFNYSKALNLGIEHSSGNLLLIMSAHAIPYQDTWLREMLSHFTNESVAGVYCKQFPWPGADWREVSRIAAVFGSEPKVFCQKNHSKEVAFSNAASCIRRSVWERHHFVVMPAVEDREWASWAVANGYAIIYSTAVQVYHSHNDSSRKAAQRRIEVEKAYDILNRRNRNIYLTYKEALGWTCKDIRKIVFLKDNKLKKLKMIRDCLACGYWYIVDFIGT